MYPLTPLPSVPGTYIHIHLLMTYQRFQSTEPLCTALYALTETIDLASRLAKMIARRTAKPAYVGCSAGFPTANVEEEIGALQMAVEGVMNLFDREG